MATVGYQSAYATDIVAVQRVFYNQVFNFSYQWLMVMSTQLIGFSIGGICRRFLVQPPSMSEFILYCLIIQITDRNSFQFGRQTWLLVRFLPFQWFLLAQLVPCRCPVQHTPLHAVCRDGKTWGYQPWKIFPVRISWVILLVLHARISLPSVELFLLGVLDCTRQYQSQSDVRGMSGSNTADRVLIFTENFILQVSIRSWNESPYLWLGSGIVFVKFLSIFLTMRFQIAYVISPLATPWWAEANVAFAFVFFYCEHPFTITQCLAECTFTGLIAPILYVRVLHRCTAADSSSWPYRYPKSTPILGTLPTSRMIVSLNSSSAVHSSNRVLNDGSFNRNGTPYDVSQIVNADGSFNQAAYEAYSPLYLSVTFALAYGKSVQSIVTFYWHIDPQRLVFRQCNRDVDAHIVGLKLPSMQNDLN